MEKRIKISVCGSEQAINKVVCESLNEIKTLEMVNSDNVSQADVIYWIFGKGPSIKKYFPVWIKKEPIIINHWVGSDVIGELKKRREPGIFRLGDIIRDCIFYWKMKNGGLINLTAAPWLVDELAKIHITATFLPITTIDKDKLGMVDTEREKDIDFLSYVPLRSFEFYGGDKIVRLAQRWPEYKFLLIFPDLNEIPQNILEKMPGNVVISPKVPRSKMNELFNRSKIFIRYTQHDAISLSVLEALYFNLQVLWTYKFPFTQKIETQEKLSDLIPSLIQNWQPNEDGHTFVTENYTTEKFNENFVKILKSKISFPE
jgi:hypothetical protein